MSSGAWLGTRAHPPAQDDTAPKSSPANKGGPVAAMVEHKLGHEAMYVVERTVFEKGGVCVHKARHKQNGRSAALKVYETVNEHADSLFEKEVECMRRVAGMPFIVQLYDVFREGNGIRTLAMEFCAGGDLFNKVVECGGYENQDAAGVIRKIATALKHLHSNGLYHRDVRCENVLLTSRRDKCSVKLCDFDNSLVLDNASVRDKQGLVGAHGYMAPELLQQRTQEIDQRADMWSLGVLLFVLLSAESPWPLDSSSSEMVLEGLYSFSTPKWAKITEESKDMIRRLLVTEPSHRLTAAQVLDHAWVRGEALAPAERTSGPEKLTALRRLTQSSQMVRNLGRLKRTSAVQPTDRLSAEDRAKAQDILPEPEPEPEPEPRMRSVSFEGAPKATSSGLPGYLAQSEPPQPPQPAEPRQETQTNGAAQNEPSVQEGSEHLEYAHLLDTIHQKEATILALPKRSPERKQAKRDIEELERQLNVHPDRPSRGATQSTASVPTPHSSVVEVTPANRIDPAVDANSAPAAREEPEPRMRSVSFEGAPKATSSGLPGYLAQSEPPQPPQPTGPLQAQQSTELISAVATMPESRVGEDASDHPTADMTLEEESPTDDIDNKPATSESKLTTSENKPPASENKPPASENKPPSSENLNVENEAIETRSPVAQKWAQRRKMLKSQSIKEAESSVTASDKADARNLLLDVFVAVRCTRAYKGMRHDAKTFFIEAKSTFERVSHLQRTDHDGIESMDIDNSLASQQRPSFLPFEASFDIQFYGETDYVMIEN